MVKEANTGFVGFRKLLAPKTQRGDRVIQVKIADESRVVDLGCPVTSSDFELALGFT